MKIINISDIKDDSIFLKKNYINGIDFLDSEQCQFVVNAAKNNITTIKKWLDLLSVNYDDAYFINGNIRYKVGNTELSLSDLSSVERYLLYLLAGREIEEQIIAGGLFERLGRKFERLVIDQFKNYEGLTVIIYNALLPEDARQYIRKEL